MNPAPRRAFIVSHTHWDREWYLTFDEFRVDMTRTVGRVLDALEADDDFRCFLLDGQAVLLEDHLEAAPADEPRLRRLVEAGRLSVGPWYVLPDEFLVSGEATVRNLLQGRRAARRFGAVHRAGYMPDSFGHLAQMPQILRRAGLDSFVFTRGLGDEAETLGWRWRWRAPDGCEVLAVNQCGGYCNAGGLGFEEIWHAHTRRAVRPELAVTKIRDLFAAMAERPGAEPALINNGCDHFPPQQDFAAVLGALREAFPDTEFVHADLPTFLRAAADDRHELPVHEGELLGGRDHPILSGVWSARMPLKQANARCQDLLARTAEPLAAYARFVHGRAAPDGVLDEAWRILLKNHPHDSICGCSIDPVHRDMETRFARVERTAERAVLRVLEDLVPHFAPDAKDDGETVLCVANPLPRPRREIVDRLVVLQPGFDDPDRLALRDDEGRDVPFVVLEKQYVERFWGVDYRARLDADRQRAEFAEYRERFGPRILKDGPGDGEFDCYWTIRFPADLPACGHRLYRLEPTDAPVAATTVFPAGTVRAVEDGLANERLQVVLHADGSFDLTDLASGRVYPGLNAWIDEADVGDEYDWCDCEAPGPRRPRCESGRVRIVENTGLRGVVETACTLRLPAEAAPERTRRSDDPVDCPAVVRLTLDAGSPRVDVSVRFANNADDHRLRVLFPTPHRTDALVGDGQFLVHERPLIRKGGESWTQPAPATWPQQDWSCVGDADGGLALFNSGLPEIEGVRGDDGGAGMALTLLRCVGWLSRDDFPSRRRTNAGPTLFTPEAQCRGAHGFRYAVQPFAGSWRDAGLEEASTRWRTPPIAMQGVTAGATPDGSLLEIASSVVQVNAIKAHGERDSLVVRLTNLDDHARVEPLVLGREIAEAWRTDLLEERLEPLAAEGRGLTVPLDPHEIATVEIVFTS